VRPPSPHSLAARRGWLKEMEALKPQRAEIKRREDSSQKENEGQSDTIRPLQARYESSARMDKKNGRVETCENSSRDPQGR